MTYCEEAENQLHVLQDRDTVRILAIETSCDESAAAIIENGRSIISSCVYSQVDLHALYGGVVPEIASRSHVQKLDLMVEQAYRDAHMDYSAS